MELDGFSARSGILADAIIAREANNMINSNDYYRMIDSFRRENAERAISVNVTVQPAKEEIQPKEICYTQRELNELFRIFEYTDMKDFEDLLEAFKPADIDKIVKDINDNTPCILYNLSDDKKKNLSNAFVLSIEKLNMLLKSRMTLHDFLNQEKNCSLTLTPICR